jgi:predicted nuclease of predicted toxin-antitoxin system
MAFTPFPFYMDVHVHHAVTKGLRSRGVDVLTARQDGRHETADPQLLERAWQLKRIFVTYDEDFFSITSQAIEEGRTFFGLVHTRQENINIGLVIEDLEIISKTSSLDDIENCVIHIPLVKS